MDDCFKVPRMTPMILMHSFSCAGVRCKSVLNTEALGPNSMRSTQLSKSLCTDAAFTAPAALDTMLQRGGPFLWCGPFATWVLHCTVARSSSLKHGQLQSLPMVVP